MIIKKLCVAVALLIIILPIYSVSAGERIQPPDGLYYYRFASSTYGAASIWSNPAALAIDKNIYVQYMIDYYDGKLSKDWSFVTSGDGFGIGFRRLESSSRLTSRYDEYIFAVGFPVNHLISAGASYQYVKAGPDYFNKRHFWNLSLLATPSPRFSYAIVLSNLNRGRVDGEKTDFEQLYSATLKTPNHKIALSVALSLSSGQSLSSAEYNYGIEIAAMPNLDIYANLHSNDSYQIGLVWNITDYFVGGQTRSDSNHNHLGTSAWGGYRNPQKGQYGH